MKYMLLSIFALLFFSSFSQAQELNATVTINDEKLSIPVKDNLLAFKKTIEDYLNNNRFSGENWEYDKIDCAFSIFFNTGSEDFSYTAQVVVRSQRKIYDSESASPMLAVNDNGWSFRYERNEALYFDPNTFNSVASFLDFYALVIIGMELESWEKMSGSDAYSTAFTIAQRGSSLQWKKGWEAGGTYSRMDLIENIINEKYRPFREATSAYHYGIDLYAKNKTEAQKYIVALVKVLDELKSKIDYRSVYLKAFFDAKSGEIIERLKDYPDKSIFKILKTVDPQRIGKYDEAMQ